MKKFTKSCLITALVLFIIGSVFCATFGMMGGFRQIDAVNRQRFGDLQYDPGKLLRAYAQDRNRQIRIRYPICRQKQICCCVVVLR